MVWDYKSFSVTIRGKDSNFAGATTDVLVRHDGQWQYVHHHETFARNPEI
jgi:ketosteroid isomerase-like protein